MISYFHIGSIANMLTARPIMALQHKENHVTTSRHLQFKKLFDATKMATSSKILMSAEIMSMSRDIKLKET